MINNTISTDEFYEHHTRVYAGNYDTGGILRAKRPARLLDHSILTPELAAAIFNAKYVNAVPLKRLSEEFLRNDVDVPRQDMAGWDDTDPSVLSGADPR